MSPFILAIQQAYASAGFKREQIVMHLFRSCMKFTDHPFCAYSRLSDNCENYYVELTNYKQIKR